MKIWIWLLVVIAWALPAGAIGLSDINITPLRTEVGGRPLSLGGAYTALADDPSAVFYNPGGLPFAKGIAATVDSGLNNIIVSQAYPTGLNSALGLAIISNRFQNVPLPAGSSTSTSGNMLIFSYGIKLAEKVGIGLNVKYLIWQTIQQVGTLDQSASVLSGDLGVLWKANEWLTLGLNGVNLSAGELRWSSGTERLASGTRFGAAAKLIGDIKSPIYWDKREFILGVEAESHRQNFAKIGGEFSIEGKYFLRGGFGNGISGGVGLRFEGWGLDLTSAREAPANERKVFISILYFPKEWIFVKKELTAWEVLGVPVENISLTDNLITYEERLDIFGKVKSGVEIKINRTPVFVGSDGVFRAQVPLLAGKNFVVLEANYFGEKKDYEYKVLRKAKVLIAEEKKKLTEGKKKEVAQKKEKLEALVTMGIVEIKPNVEFELESRVTRGELATWLVKASGIPLSPVVRDVFRDVAKDHPQAFYIKTAADLKLMKAFPDGTFRPKQAVSEEEGRAIFQKFGIVQ